MFEAVPRAAADYPDIVMLRVTVNDEVVVWAVLVLANSAFEQRSILQPGETEPHIVAHRLESIGAYGSVTRSRIEFVSTCIIGDFEAASLISRNAVDETLTMISPNRNLAFRVTVISRGGAEEKYFLPGGADAPSDSLRKKFAQPRTAGEDVLIRRELRTI